MLEMLAACGLDHACYSWWHLWKVPERQHRHLLPRWLVAIFPLWVSTGTPGKQSPFPPTSSSGLTGAVAQLSPMGSTPVLVLLCGQWSYCLKEPWSPVWWLFTWSGATECNSFVRRKLSGSCIRLGGFLLVKEIILLGGKKAAVSIYFKKTSLQMNWARNWIDIFSDIRWFGFQCCWPFQQSFPVCTCLQIYLPSDCRYTGWIWINITLSLIIPSVHCSVA